MSGVENLTINGLPAHPLIVHAVVVGVPVMALVAWIMLSRASWRAAWAWPVAVIVALLVPVAFLARATGQGLQAALGGQIAADHAEYGLLAPFFVSGMALGAVGFAVLRRRGRLASVIGALLLVATSVAALGWVVVTGDSGARSVWGSVISG